MSLTEVYNFEKVSELINQFQIYNQLFSAIFLQYNGQNQIITMQYRLRTFNLDYDNKIIDKFIEQYIKNPISIPSELYSVEIYSQDSLVNLAQDKKYFQRIENFFIFNISNLMKLDSDFITIIINSNFKLNFKNVVSLNVSKQPKRIEEFKNKYELVSFLKSNDFPEKFQFLNIPISFSLILNDFINYFIPKKMIMAHSRWYKLELKSRKNSRKKNEYAKMIENKYNISPLGFGIKLDKVLNEILLYIQNNFHKIIKIINIDGKIYPEIPTAYHLSEATGIIKINFNFTTNFDNLNCGTISHMIFDFRWMKKIFREFF